MIKNVTVYICLSQNFTLLVKVALLQINSGYSHALVGINVKI